MVKFNPHRRNGPRRKNYRGAKPAYKKKQYKKFNKKRMVARRNPMVENKSQENSIPLTAISRTDALNINIPTAFVKFTQGLGGDNIIGDSIFMKYMKTKMRLDLSRYAVDATGRSPDLYVMHGWCTAGLPPTDVSTGTTSLEAHVHTKLAAQYGHTVATHRLAFKSKLDGIKLLSMRKIKFRRPYINDDSPAFGGATPDVYMSLTWPGFKKLHLFNATDAGATNMFVKTQQTWVPFWCVWCPDFNTSDPNVKNIEIQSHSKSWYSDS
jgi:hypothetical protein